MVEPDLAFYFGSSALESVLSEGNLGIPVM